MMKKMKEKKQIWIGLAALLILGIASFIYWSAQKEVWFCDEIYSYESANGFEQSWPATNVAQWMTGEDVEDFFSADGDSLSLKRISDVLYGDHVPLFFWLFRMVSLWFFKGSGTIWIGLTINLVFYILYLTVGYLWMSKLTKNPVAAGVILLIGAVLTKTMISQTTMLRMYVMLAFAELLLILVGARILREINGKKMKAMTFIYMFIFSVFGLLTHYDYWVFYAVTATVFCCWLLIKALQKKKRFWKSIELKYVMAWVGNFIASLGATIAIFPYCRWNLNKGKGQTALHSLVVFSEEKTDLLTWGMERLKSSFLGDGFPMIAGLLIMLGCITGGAIVLYKRKEKEKCAGLIITIIISLVYQFFICFTMPAVAEERYLWGTFTLIHLCILWSVYLVADALCKKIKDAKKSNLCKTIVCSVVAAVVIAGQILIVDGGNNIPYLFHPDKDVKLLEENSNIPWVVYGPTGGVYSYYDWMMAEEICFLSPDETAEDALAVQQLSDRERFVMYAYPEYEELAMNFFERELGKELKCEELTKSTNLTVYVISAE